MVCAAAKAPNVDAVVRSSRCEPCVDKFDVSARISLRGGVERWGVPPSAAGVAVRKNERARPLKNGSDSRRRFGARVVAARDGVAVAPLLDGVGAPAAFDEIRVMVGWFG